MIQRCLLVGVMAFMVVSCADSTGPAVKPAQNVQSLVFEPADTLLQMFQTLQLRVSAFDSAGRKVSITADQLSFSTSDSAVMVVNSAGTVHGSGWGTAIITVQAGALRASVTLHSAPKEVDLGGVELVTIDEGRQHMCGKDVVGELFCWGQNNAGALGIADTLSQSEALPTVVPGGSAYVNYGAGQLMSCGLNAIGEIWCWGAKNGGALGDGVVLGPPARVPVKVSGNHVWRDLAVGEIGTTCGVTDANVPYCWGNNTSCQVGRDPCLLRSLLSDPHVALVSGGYEMTEIDVADFDACGLSPAGQPLCWGQDVARHDHALPRSIVAPPLASISVGAFLNECGLTATGEAWCWGETPDRNLHYKQNVDAVPFAPGLRFTKLALSAGYGCGITTDGDLHCWGKDHVWSGPTDAPPPRLGESGMKFLDVDTFEHGIIGTCALTTKHRLYCWMPV